MMTAWKLAEHGGKRLLVAENIVPAKSLAKGPGGGCCLAMGMDTGTYSRACGCRFVGRMLVCCSRLLMCCCPVRLFSCSRSLLKALLVHCLRTA